MKLPKINLNGLLKAAVTIAAPIAAAKASELVLKGAAKLAQPKH